MSDVDLGVDSDDLESGRIQPLPDTWQGLPSMTPEEEEAMARQFFEKLDATLAQRGEPKGSAGFAASAASMGAAGARAEGERQAVEEGLTVRSPTFDERAVVAPPAAPIVAAPPADAGEARAAKGGAIEDLAITRVDVQVPAEFRKNFGKLPFKAPTAENEFARTKPVPVLNPWQGQTAPLGDNLIEKAVAALPFAGNKVGAGVVPVPRLSLEAYASLRAELLVGPERSGEILRRYHVMNEAARRALEEHWQAEFAASPEARTRFEKLLADYTAWLRTPRV